MQLGYIFRIIPEFKSLRLTLESQPQNAEFDLKIASLITVIIR